MSKYPSFSARLQRHNAPRHTPRLHVFPPLRKAMSGSSDVDHDGNPGTAPRQQVADGYKDGLDQGFSRGFDEGKQEGYEEGSRLGYDTGWQQGQAEGRQQAGEQFQAAAAPLAALVAEWTQFLARYEQQRREELLQLVEKVTHQVIRCELALQPGQLLALVDEALQSLPEQPESIRVLLNQEAYQRIKEIAPAQAAAWGLSADPTMAPGECRVITADAEMDVGCQHRLEQCMDALKTTLLPEDQDE